jgi:hypothetical protein
LFETLVWVEALAGVVLATFVATRVKGDNGDETDEQEACDSLECKVHRPFG